jgi:hypothetical protein
MSEVELCALLQGVPLLVYLVLFYNFPQLMVLVSLATIFTANISVMACCAFNGRVATTVALVLLSILLYQLLELYEMEITPAVVVLFVVGVVFVACCGVSVGMLLVVLAEQYEQVRCLCFLPARCCPSGRSCSPSRSRTCNRTSNLF